MDAAEISEHQAPDKETAEYSKRDLSAARARVGLLEKQAADLDRQVERKSAMLAQRSTKGIPARPAQGGANRLRCSLPPGCAIFAASGFRGERLRIIDPGIVPQRPSYPNVPLNVFSALAFAAVASILYLSVTFQTRPTTARQPLRFAAKKADG